MYMYIKISDGRANAPPCPPLAKPLPCSTSLLLASNNICFQKSGDMLNKNTLGVKKVRGQLEAALQTGATMLSSCNKESVTQSSSKSVQPVFCYSFIKSSFH